MKPGWRKGIRSYALLVGMYLFGKHQSIKIIGANYLYAQLIPFTTKDWQWQHILFTIHKYVLKSMTCMGIWGSGAGHSDLPLGGEGAERRRVITDSPSSPARPPMAALGSRATCTPRPGQTEHSRLLEQGRNNLGSGTAVLQAALQS